MTQPRRKRLIEVAFPLDEVSADSRKDPYRGIPHRYVGGSSGAKTPVFGDGFSAALPQKSTFCTHCERRSQ